MHLSFRNGLGRMHCTISEHASRSAYSIFSVPSVQLMYVNSQWDVEYGEQKEAFRRFRTDSQLAQKENQETIARLRAENELLKDQIRAQETNHSGKEPATTVKRQRPTDLPLKVARDLPAASSVEVQTEIALLRHQVSVQ